MDVRTTYLMFVVCILHSTRCAEVAIPTNIIQLLYDLTNKVNSLQYKISLLSPLVFKDCSDYMQHGYNKSGIYKITTCCGKVFEVYCDMENHGGGWLVIQRRRDGSENFYRDWNDYRNGFGDLNNEFWLGNDYIAVISNLAAYELRVDLEDFTGATKYALYSQFSINAQDKYKLSLGSYSGDAGDSLGSQRNHRWSTYDSDNDVWPKNCAYIYKGAWWYGSCHRSNLNGIYHGGAHASYADGVNWYDWKGHNYSLRFTEMKIRRL